MKDTSKKALRRGHNEGNIRRRTDGRWEVRLSAGIDYKTGKPRRTSTCCNMRQEAIAILQQQAHEVRTQGWRDPMSVTLGEWYEYWLNTYMKDTVKQSTYSRSSSRSKKPCASTRTRPFPQNKNKLSYRRTACWYSSKQVDRSYFYLPTPQDFPQKTVPDVEKLNIRDGLILCFFRPAGGSYHPSRCSCLRPCGRARRAHRHAHKRYYAPKGHPGFGRG